MSDIARYRLAAVWFGLSVLLLGIMLGHESDPPHLVAHYSRSYAAMLGVMVMLTLLAGTAWQRVRMGDRPDRWIARVLRGEVGAWIVAVGGPAALGAYWRLMPGARNQIAITLFLIYGAALLFTGMVVALVSVRRTERTLPRVWVWGGAVVLCLIIAALAIRFVGDVPPSLENDEPSQLNKALATYSDGKPSHWMFPGKDTLQTAMSITIAHPVLGGVLAQTGVSLETGRWFWLAVAWAGAPFIALAARMLYGHAAAIVALLLALVLPLGHNYIRPDALVGTLLAAGLYFFFSARQRESHWRYAVAGFLTAFAVEGHRYGARFALVIALGLGMAYVAQVWTTRRWQWYAPFWYFTAGAGCAGVLFIAGHSLLWGYSLDAFFDAVSGTYESERGLAPGDGSFKPSLITRVSGRWITEYAIRHPVESALLVGGLLMAAWRRTRSDLWLAGILTGATVMFAVLLAHFNPYYWIHHLPLVAILGGAFVAWIAHLDGDRPLNRVALAASAALIVLVAANLAVRSEGHDARQLIAVAHTLHDTLPDEVERVAGHQVYYYRLSDRDYVQLGALQQKPAALWQADWGVPPPQAVILSLGRDHAQPAVQDYIREADLRIARCVEADVPLGYSVLYLPADLLPDGAPIGCPPHVLDLLGDLPSGKP